jgi:hypothetical protein
MLFGWPFRVEIEADSSRVIWEGIDEGIVLIGIQMSPGSTLKNKILIHIHFNNNLIVAANGNIRKDNGYAEIRRRRRRQRSPKNLRYKQK